MILLMSKESSKDAPPPRFKSINNATGASAKFKCSVCQGDHFRLLQCSKLLSFIPGGNFKPLPKSVCNICLSSDVSVTSPQCHQNLDLHYSDVTSRKFTILYAETAQNMLHFRSTSKQTLIQDLVSKTITSLKINKIPGDSKAIVPSLE